MKLRQAIPRFGVDHPKLVVSVMVLLTAALGAFIPFAKVDTDPENMLSPQEAVRKFHQAAKKEFALHDMVVVGVVNEKHPDGVFNPQSLRRVYELTQFAKSLRWDKPEGKTPAEAGGKRQSSEGVIEYDLLAPSTVDYVDGSDGTLRFSYVMDKPPATPEEAREVGRRLMGNPLLKGTLVSEDGKALCLYVPLTAKDLSYRVYSELRRRIATFHGDEQYFITGLPVAEDTFGVEMFVQMAISAPLAMACIFVLMLVFFRRVALILSPLVVAMVSTVTTMGLLVATGNTVHVMSSMIPIFLMPYSVVDSVHMLSEFFDSYQATRDRRLTILQVIENLFTPMLYTSLTTIAGFASLALTPIPPVQVFGIFVAVGVGVAWVWTVLFIPAYVMLLPARTLENFGVTRREEAPKSWLTRLLAATGRFTYVRAKLVIGVFAVLGAVAAYGISRIQINDNPVKWFARSHPIRVADQVLNRHFGGTYMAYLVLEPKVKEVTVAEAAEELRRSLDERGKALLPDAPKAKPIFEEFARQVDEALRHSDSAGQMLSGLTDLARERGGKARGDEAEAWGEIGAAIADARTADQVFKRPDVLQFVRRLQAALEASRVVGKSNSVADAVMKVYQELLGGKGEAYRIPDTRRGVAETLMQYQNSHDPDDLWHLVTPDYRKANVWVQLRSGDNQDMSRVVALVDKFMQESESPVALEHRWAGLTYLNVVWQERMVSGMLQSFAGSFLVVFVMMVVLFRSSLWGLLSMIPLTLTIVLIYGIIGLAGKDYDMPVAVLSSLTLGMSVDFAIHFLERSRAAMRERGLWREASALMFGEPARAISRNAIVISLGFLPLLAAPLVPYRTVGVFMASIMAFSAAATLLILPALMRLAAPLLFRLSAPRGVTCNCAACIVASAASVLLVALNVHQYAVARWTTLTWACAAAIPLLVLTCGVVSRRRACRLAEGQAGKEGGNV